VRKNFLDAMFRVGRGGRSRLSKNNRGFGREAF
jgi:hypothetical protein